MSVKARVFLQALDEKIVPATVQTIRAGSAVTMMDRAATFDALAVNGTPISDYVENNLYVRVDGDSWIGDGVPTVFDPFHGAESPLTPFYFPFGGSTGWVTIEGADSHVMYGVEFLYGNGWTTGDIYGQYPWGNNGATLEWQTWKSGAMVSSGEAGVSPLLNMGTVVGFSDSTGFDQLLVRSRIATAVDPNIQALALDNLHVQVQPPPPQPATIGAVTVNDGTLQRSRVTSVKVDFSQLVTLPADPSTAFQLTRQSDNAPVTIQASVTNTTTTSVTLTFTGGPVDTGSLADGRYTLTAFASQINGGQFDGNGDGIAGDNYALVGDPATNKLFRLYGDVNGDGTVSASDFIVFRQFFGGANAAFDFDGDGSVSASDFIQFRLRFGGSI